MRVRQTQGHRSHGLARASGVLVLALALVLAGHGSAQTYEVPVGTLYDTPSGTWVKTFRNTWRNVTTNGLMPELPNAPTGLARSPSLALARGGAVRTTITTVAKPVAGTAMRWSGGALLTGALFLTTALEYIYNSAQESIHPDLDEYWEGPGGSAVPAADYSCKSGDYIGQFVTIRPCNFSEIAAAVDALDGPTGSWSGAVELGGHLENVSQMTGEGDVRTGTNTKISGSTIYTCASGPWSVAAMEACADMALQAFLDGLLGSGWGLVGDYVRPDLAQFLEQHEDAGQALDAKMEDYFDELGNDPAFPYTYAEPFGTGVGFELDPPPNINQWYGNPWANPTTDTDGDGWSDAEEAAAGTDPNNPYDYPSEDPFEDELGNPLPDRDGDGVPDQFDPCPYQASNECADQQLPDDIATETTLREIRDELKDDGGSPAGAVFVDPAGDFLAWVPWQQTSTVWDEAIADMTLSVNDLAGTLQTKMPFGFAAWFPDPGVVGSGSICGGVELEVSGVDTSVDICDNPFDTFLAGTGRSTLLALVWVMFVLGVVRRVQQA